MSGVLKTRIYGNSASGASGSSASAGAANEIQKGNGTGGFAATGVFSSVLGNLTLGSDALTLRTIAAGGSGANVSVLVKSKGTGSATLQAEGALAAVQFIHGAGGQVEVQTLDDPNNTVHRGLKIRRQCVAAPAVGIGAGMEFDVLTAVGNREIGGAIECVTTSITAGVEDFDLVFRTMSGGAAAAERMRWVSATGRLSVTGDVVASGAVQSGTGFTATNGQLTATIDNATNNGVTPLLDIIHTTSGAPANGIGVSMRMQAETSNGNIEVGATIEAVATDVTAASEDFDLVFKTMVAGAAVSEHMRMGSNKIGFFGVASVARQLVPTGSTTDQVITALQNLGLFRQA